MSTHDKLALAAAVALGLTVADAAEAPRFGQPITPTDLAAWDISIALVRSAMARRAAEDRASRWSAVVRSTALTAIR